MNRSARAGALVMGALRLHEAGDLAASEAMCREALALNRASADAWHLLAIALFAQHRLSEAREAAEQATRLRPGIAAYALTNGNVALAAGDWTAAAAAYERASRIDGTLADAAYGLARALRAAGRLDDALPHFERAFLCDPAYLLERSEGVECFAAAAPEALSDFWRAELERYFASPGPHRWRHARAALTAVRTLPEFQSASRARAPEAEMLAMLAREPLLGMLLSENVIVDPQVERLLVKWRRLLLEDVEVRNAMPVEFLRDLAIQCFSGEYAMASSEEEGASAYDLAVAPPEDEAGSRAAAVAAMYHPLLSLPREALDAVRRHSALGRLLELTVEPVLEEERLKASIPALGTIDDEISIRVRAQYEANPYPRLASLDPPAPQAAREWLAGEIPGLGEALRFPERPEILVAGCGTGAVAIGIARRLPSATVVALDLSLSSLAHGKRVAGALGVENLEFLQGDILSLVRWDRQFDLIHCTGVLHHMADPEAGARALCTRLRPGGLLLLGLYSERARRIVNEARQSIAKRGLQDTVEGIRSLRRDILAEGESGPLWPLTATRDFYSVSGCRDLLFHVQERQYRLPEVAAMLDRLGLKPVNLASHAPAAALAAFRSIFPGSEDYADFDKWDEVEARHPDLFESMIQVWCQAKPGA